MIETFRQDLEQLIKSGWLDRSSEFVRDALRIISELQQKPTEQHVLNSRPQTETESAIATTLEKSLGILRRSR